MPPQPPVTPRSRWRVAAAAIVLALAAPAAGAQPVAPRGPAPERWNDVRVTALVRLATERRARQLADTGLADYRAQAHGYLTFLAQVGEGFPEPPKVVKADELALEVLWRVPDLSKQRIVGRRDTLLLPTDINYHRDHLGIVQNNFPDIIRLGDGDEVLDVPHPLSPAGLEAYDFAISDSLAIRLPDRAIEVYQVRVRPKNDREPRAVGAVYLERGTGQVVRMAFSFTRAALRDRQLEDVSVVLENGLIDGRFWLPRRQEIEIRRTGSWLDYPARGIIRGRWEICCYEVNTGLPRQLFIGPEIVQAPEAVLREHRWDGRILDSLPPDVRAVTDADVRVVQEEARALVRAEALARTRGLALSARGISDFVRVNRAEGIALGAGLTRRLGGGVRASAYGRWGFGDDEAKGRLTLGWQRASGAGAEVFAYRAYRDASDEPETSLLRNSLAAQEFGSDYTEPYDARGGGVAAELGRRFGASWRLEGVYETQRAVSVHARPASGRYARTIPALALRATRLTLAASRPTAMGPFGSEIRAAAELRLSSYVPREGPLEGDREGVGRLFASLHAERPSGARRLMVRATLTAVAGAHDVPAQELVYLGGPTSAPGYGFHELAGRAGATTRVEWRTPVPFPSIPLGRFGRTSASATLAPFAHLAYVSRPPEFQPPRQGWYPSLGVGGLLLFELLRVDVARGLRDGRWALYIDVSREFWPIL